VGAVLSGIAIIAFTILASFPISFFAAFLVGDSEGL
jgi:hypothetical protein